MRISSPEIIVVGILVLVLLVVIAPGMLYKREQARQMLKRDRLKQVGMSLNSYHDTFGMFPASPVAKKKPVPKEEPQQEMLISPL